MLSDDQSEAEETFLSLENASGRIEEEVRALSKAIAQLSDAAGTGNVSLILRAISTSYSISSDLEQRCSVLNQLYTKEHFARLFAQKAYLIEIAAKANSLNLHKVRGADHKILSFPLALSIDFEALAFRLPWKAKLNTMRPSALAEYLSKARADTGHPQTVAFLDGVEDAYNHLTVNAPGIAVPIQEVYNKLTPLPRFRKEYGLDQFLLDLAALDSFGPRTANSGREIEFQANASGKSGRGYRLADTNGIERLYSSILFK